VVLRALKRAPLQEALEGPVVVEEGRSRAASAAATTRRLQERGQAPFLRKKGA